MFGIKRIVIAQHERGLFFKFGRLVDVLEPGAYWIKDFSRRYQVEVHDLTVPEFGHPLDDFFLKESPELSERYFQVVELGAHEVGLVYKNGRLASILAPSTRHLYWKGPIEVKVEKVNISENFAVSKPLLKQLAFPREKELIDKARQYLVIDEVADSDVGLLIVDGELHATLEPGLYGFWKFNRTVKVVHVDLRLQAMEVSGQEILTKDKVSLRANLSATFKVTDPVKARSSLKDFEDFLYRELQFGLRQAIGTRTLDALLGSKGELDRVVYEHVSAKVAPHGVDVRSVGIKDLILPGEMKDILNQVVQAEKIAQANVIKRREETSATRSLLNTAKLMDDNPTLKRLKELEVLEKVSEKVDRLTVFGGLDGVLKDTVKINVRGE